MSKERVLLASIGEAIKELEDKSNAGGEVEHCFNLHIDRDKLRAAYDLLVDQCIATDKEYGSHG